ncbi:Gfo/Idh/MocA family oxidoreductase [Streptomyces filamentosus]|uniref:Gfo/Idh/MocA family oxidoreductase n=2 Tax=Streptomyces filamentosus TaxID=67294 RepID=A0ABY4UYT6_STRFL|nr:MULTISPECIES: Gfo/Idh/MocA family oxidoreductase [Streptomyces]EFE74827.1 oxidoreductase [Streptomyces filamentosus NRRL 15998]ESU50862.1 putative oxidoreductase [Streptomyces sp. HCCB10043]EWS91909.1 oxidoreductase [Streptomyces filamentosus NRRL 11379]MYR78928.1 Gfo/Idh/MocA family oxidoreductase [Streptomyces sp. SID5466]USC49468.1 Gfo/Idh/MocA family oxidoreductase [Streptomyces filamentosus]
MTPNAPAASGATGAPLRVALVGYGLAGSVFHAPLVSATDGLVLDTVVTSNEERRAEARAAHPKVRFAASPDELWERADELDLVVIASPNKTHVPLATAALKAGLPVVVDKPIAGTAAEARELAALAEERGLLLSVFQNRRWDNDFRTLAALIADGELGEVQRFESRFERWRPQLKGGWRESGDPDEIGGLLYDLGSHVVDQALVLFGPAVQVYAESDVRRPGAAADDDTFIAITHENGVRSHLYVSATTAQLGPRFRVLGSAAGYVKYGLDPQEAVLREGLRPVADEPWGEEVEQMWGRIGSGESPLTGGGTPVRTLPGDYPAYYAAVAAAIRGTGDNPVTALQAAAALDVLEAARRSAREGVTVTLPGNLPHEERSAS